MRTAYYAAQPDVLTQQLEEDEAIAADTLMLTVPNRLGFDYNAHAIDSILTHLAPALGWRQASWRPATSTRLRQGPAPHL